MLGKLSWKDQSHGSLDLARYDCGLCFVVCKLCCLCCNLFDDVVDKEIQNGHSLGTDACVWVHYKGKVRSAFSVRLGLKAIDNTAERLQALMFHVENLK